MEVAGFTHAYPGFRVASHFIISSADMMRVSFAMGSASMASAAYPAANLALYVPFTLEVPVTVYETWVMTGTLTTSNGTEIGVYDTSGNRLFTTATTVAVASDFVNSSGMTDYVLDRGTYYLAFGCDGTRTFQAGAQNAGIYQGLGVMEQTGLTGANLPSTWTPVATTRAYLPLFGLHCRSTTI